MAVWDWVTTAADNDDADSAINWAEGQAPSTVNDSARSMMARISHWLNTLSGNVTMGGASNAYTLTTGESLSAYPSNFRVLWQPNADSTGAVTLNVDAIGAKKVYMPDGTQAGSGDLDADSMYDVAYDGALDSASGGFKIIGFPDTTLTAADYLTAANNLSDLASASTARSNLGLGSLAVLSSVNDGNWSGTDLAVANGGTGASDASTARTNLGAYGSGSNASFGTLTATGDAQLQGDAVVNMSAAGQVPFEVSRLGSSVSYTPVTGTTATFHKGGSGTGSPSFVQIMGGSATENGLLIGDDTDPDAASIRHSSSTGTTTIQHGSTDLVSIDSSGDFDFNGNSVRARGVVNSSVSGTLNQNDHFENCVSAINGNITVPTASGGCVGVLCAHGAGSITVTRGSGLAMYVNGVNVASATIPARGIVTAIYQTGSIVHMKGDIS